jgi:hypothetical protein
MPNTQGATGWQIPTVYGDPIAFDEIATYNRAKRLLYPPQTYFTADETIEEIRRLSGDRAYASSTIVGITALSKDPDLPSFPEARGTNDPQWAQASVDDPSAAGDGFFDPDEGEFFGSSLANVPSQFLRANSAINAANVEGLVFNLATYGGVCDGVTPDDTALALALGAIGSTQAILVLPYTVEGQCLLALDATIPANVTIDFDASGTGFLLTNSRTLTIVGPMISVPHQVFFNARSGQGTVSFSGSKVTTDCFGEWWGATGNGTTDDKAALQAACTALDSGSGGTLWLNGATYNIGSTLSVGSASAQHYINIEGIGPVTSILSYSGATNSIAVKLNNEKYTALKGVRIVNAVAKGTTEGVRSSGPNSGTNTTGLITERVIIDGFHYGWHASDGGTNTSSELSLIAVTFQNCDTGFLNDNFNAISVNLYDCGFALNTIGVDNEAGENMNLFGGSFSTNDTDLKIRASTAMYGVYTESTVGAALDVSSGAGNTKVTAINCTFGNGASTPNGHTMVTINGGKVTLQNCNVSGQVVCQQADDNRSLILINNHICDPNNTWTLTAPTDNMGPGFRLVANAGGGGQFVSLGNTQTTGGIGTIVAEWPAVSDGYVSVNPGTGQGMCVSFSVGQGAALAVSGNAITPTSHTHHVGAGLIKNITLPTGFTAGCVILITGATPFTTDASGNIARATTPAAAQMVTMCYDPVAALWYPSL